MENKVSTRDVSRADYDWLFELHTATMREYVEPVYGWEPDVQEKLFFYDFRPDAIAIITKNEVDVGMVELDRDRQGYFLRRLEVHPDYQNQGIGSKIIRGMISEAAAAGERLWLTVLKENPARNLYERLGFKMIEELTNHFKMIHVGEVGESGEAALS